MVNETVLLESLVALTNVCKAQMVMFSGMSREVAALRDTVRSLDPTFDEVFESKYGNLPDEAARQVTQLLDAAILQLKSDLIQ